MVIQEPVSKVVAAGRDPQWYRTATRWTQLTFTDDDPASFDLDFWIDVLRRTESNALCLSAGGYLAFYPTSVPLHRRSAHLGGGDPFGELVEAARGLGMHVMARVDPHAVHQEAADAHPEWLSYDPDGLPRAHESMPGLWWTDPLSTYHTEFTTEVALEIVRDYDVDAVFANRWEGPPSVSYGEVAAQRFRQDSGMDLPRSDDLEDPAWGAYSAWRSRRLSELVVHWDDAVSAVRPHVRFIPNRGASLTRDLVPELVDDRYPMFFVDKQGRAGDEATWTPGRIGKRARGLFPERPVALITSVGPEDHELRWKDSVAHPHETRGLVIDGFAQGALPWFTKFKAECFDVRWVEPISHAFRLHARVERETGGLRHTAEVALLDGRRPEGATPWSPVAERRDHEDGIYHALVTARIPFEYIAEEALSAQRLEGVRVLILPACPALSAENIEVIETFVARGGSLIAIHDSGIAVNDSGEREIALGALLGVRLIEDVRGPLKNKYMTLDPAHDLSRGFDGARRIIAGTRVLGVEIIEEASTEVPFRFVPDYPDLPMEEVYPRPGESTPAVVTRRHPGRGRTVHVAFDLGAVYWRALQHDHARLLSNAVEWALGERGPRIRVEGKGLVDIAVREGPGELAVTLVNLTDPMAMRGQRHELIPLRDQTVRIQIPERAVGLQAHLVIAGTPARTSIDAEVLSVYLDELEEIEVIHLSWEQQRPETLFVGQVDRAEAVREGMS